MRLDYYLSYGLFVGLQYMTWMSRTGFAAAAFVYRMVRNLKGSRELSEKAVALDWLRKEAASFKAIPNRRLNDGVAHIVVNPIDYRRIQLVLKIQQQITNRILGEVEKPRSKVDEDVQLLSNVLIVWTLLEKLGVVAGTIPKIWHEELSGDAEYIVKKFLNDFDNDMSACDKVIDDHLDKITLAVKMLGKGKDTDEGSQEDVMVGEGEDNSDVKG